MVSFVFVCCLFVFLREEERERKIVGKEIFVYVQVCILPNFSCSCQWTLPPPKKKKKIFLLAIKKKSIFLLQVNVTFYVAMTYYCHAPDTLNCLLCPESESKGLQTGTVSQMVEAWGGGEDVANRNVIKCYGLCRTVRIRDQC